MSGRAASTWRRADRGDLPEPGAPVHLIGVGGAGMRGLAVLLDRAGYEVSGCDQAPADSLHELTARGIRVETGHDAAHVAGQRLVVRSSAVPADLPEVAAAATAGIPVLRRARALGALLNGGPLAGVAGTHGKTTITAMCGHAAAAAELDPLALVGGHVPAWNGFVRLGRGPAVVEADEFDRSFLELRPTVAVVSSLEAEHLDTYGDDRSLRSAFAEFVEPARDAGGLIYCEDDEGARRLARTAGFGRGYGFSEDAWCRIEPCGPRSSRLAWPGGKARVELQVPGRHNQLNAAAALLAAVRLGAEPEAAAHGLAEFGGVGRRLELIADSPSLKVFDDYAHHPTEVAASIAALREAHPSARLTVVFQPHLFTRTRDFAEAFAGALETADRALVLPVYAAREAPIPGVSAQLITRAGGRGVTTIEREAALDVLTANGVAACGGAVVVFMGAGDVTDLARAAVRRRAEGAVGA